MRLEYAVYIYNEYIYKGYLGEKEGGLQKGIHV